MGGLVDNQDGCSFSLGLVMICSISDSFTTLEKYIEIQLLGDLTAASEVPSTGLELLCEKYFGGVCVSEIYSGVSP